MHFKTSLRQVGLLLIVILLCSNGASAGTFEVAPGSRTYVPNINAITSVDGVTVSGSALVFAVNGTAEFDFLLPFESNYLEVTYSGNGANVDLTLAFDDERFYTDTLSAGETTCQIPIQEFYGSKIMRLSASAAVTITKLTYQDIDWVYSEQNLMNSNLSDYEHEVLNAVIVKNDAAAMKSRGAIRWLDMENRFLTPINVEGSLYVPLQTIANELSLYCEDYADKNYILLRGETDSLVLFGGEGYLENELGEKTNVTINVLYQEGKTWVPLRKLAETFGLYVAYRDGYAVIDDRITAENILTRTKFYSELQAELSAYIPPVEGSITGNIYHVAQVTNAADTNPGTETQPFLTLNKAGEVAQAGDTVIVHEGTYRECFTPQNDGTVFAPITFRAATGEQPVISALEPLTDMTVEASTGMWTAESKNLLGFGRNQLFYQGKALEAGRHPNTDTHPLYKGFSDNLDSVWPTAGNICVPVTGGDYAISSTDLNQERNYWNGGTFITFKGEAWTMVSGDIISSNSGRINLKDHDESRSYSLGLKGSEAHGGMKFFASSRPTSDWGYITNHVNTIDLAGEWCIDSAGLLTLKAPTDAKINVGFELKARQRVVNLNDRKYITLDGIDTIGGGMTMNGDATEGNVLTNGSFKYLGHTTRYTDPQKGLIDTDVARNVDGPIQWGELGIYITGKNNTVTHCSINYSAGPGIILAGTYSYIYNNDLINCSYMPGYLAPITLMPEPDKQGSGVPRGGDMVIYNTIDYAGRSAMCVFGADSGGGFSVDWFDGYSMAYLGGEVAYNYFGHYGIGTTDTGGYYCYAVNLGTDKSYTKIHHNIFGPHVLSAADHRSMVAALYSDGWTSGGYGYQNLSYYEDKDNIGNQLHYRHANVDGGVASHWLNNRTLGWTPEGLEKLNASDYPDGKAFHAGSFLDVERFMMNYSELSGNVERDFEPDAVRNAVDSGGTVIGKTYRFEDINLPSNDHNYLTLYTTVSSKASDDQCLTYATIYDASGAEVASHEYLSSFPGHNWFEPETVEACIVLPKVAAGKYTIEVTIESTRVDVHQMRVDELADKTTTFTDSKVLEPGSWDEAIRSCPNGYEHLPLGKSGEGMTAGNLMSSFSHKILWNAWDHTAVYKNRNIDQTYSGIEFTYATGDPTAGAVVELYVDTLASTPIATFTATAHPESPIAWMKQTKTVTFTEPLGTGTHTFYLKFNGCGTCTTIYSMDLLTVDALDGAE